MNSQNDDSKTDLAVPVKRAPVLWLAALSIFLVCVSIVTFNIWQLQHAKLHELHQAEIATSNLSKSLAQQAEDTFDEADIILVDLVERLRVDGQEVPQVDRLERLLAQHVLVTQQLQGVFYYDRTGKWIVSSFGIKPANANNADREYFKYHEQNVNLGPHIGKAVRSRTTNEWIIPLSRRVNDADGNFDGVVLATIDMKYFDRFFDSFHMDEKGAIFMSLTDGTILARRPFTDEVVGKSLARGDVFTNYLSKSTSGTAMVTSIIDKVTRLYGYRQLEKYPLVVAAAISEQSLLEEWRANSYKSMVIIVIAVIANILFGILLFQQIRFGLRAEANMRIAQTSLEKLALQDSMTGLSNRRHFERVLNIEFRRSGRKKTPLSLIMLDIDFFKSFNDSYGHFAGDQCIVSVADILRASIHRAGDLAVRYGGEEMAIFLPDTDAEGALALAERIRLSILARQIPHEGNPLGIVTASLGCYTCVPGEQNTIESLIQLADSALYSAKNTGRNRSVMFE